MRTVSDNITGPSPIMIAAIVGSSILSILPVCFALYNESAGGFQWNTMSHDFKTLLVVFLFLVVLMSGLCWMMLSLRITIKADRNMIKARIFPFMRSDREVVLSEVERIRVISFTGGLGKYGGVGFKKNFMGRTSYTLHLKGYALVIYLKDKKELHVEISKVEEWKRFVEAFENRTL